MAEIDAKMKALNSVVLEGEVYTTTIGPVAKRAGEVVEALWTPDMESMTPTIMIQDFRLSGNLARQIADAVYQPTMSFYYNEKGWKTLKEEDQLFLVECKIKTGLMKFEDMSLRWWTAQTEDEIDAGNYGGELFEMDTVKTMEFIELLNRELEIKFQMVFHIINWNQGLPVIK